MSDSDRRCTTCGKSIDDECYELWLFHICRSCALEPAPARWSAGMAPGTSIKWSYTPRWHLDDHPRTGGKIVADGPQTDTVSQKIAYRCISCDDFELVKRYSGCAGTPGQEEFERIEAPDQCPACGDIVERVEVKDGR